jgi:hypothetical protein
MTASESALLSKPEVRENSPLRRAAANADETNASILPLHGLAASAVRFGPDVHLLRSPRLALSVLVQVGGLLRLKRQLLLLKQQSVGVLPDLLALLEVAEDSQKKAMGAVAP